MCDENGNTIASTGAAKPAARRAASTRASALPTSTAFGATDPNAATMAPASASPNVIVLPLRPSVAATTRSVRTPPSPSVAAIGIGDSICAPSSKPNAIRSRRLAQDATGVSETATPWRRKNPFSCAINNGAASVSGTYPSRSVSALDVTDGEGWVSVNKCALRSATRPGWGADRHWTAKRESFERDRHWSPYRPRYSGTR